MEAARGILANDPALKQLGTRARSRIVRGRVNVAHGQTSLPGDLWQAAKRAFNKDSIDALQGGDATAKIAGLRILMAFIIVKYFKSSSEKVSVATLERAALFLREAKEHIALLTQQEHGARRTEKPKPQDDASEKVGARRR